MSIKERRAALGWARAELARRAGLDSQVVQLAELGMWSEEGALQRLEEVLARSEAGEEEVVLPPPDVVDEEVFHPQEDEEEEG